MSMHRTAVETLPSPLLLYMGGHYSYLCCCSMVSEEREGESINEAVLGEFHSQVTVETAHSGGSMVWYNEQYYSGTYHSALIFLSYCVQVQTPTFPTSVASFQSILLEVQETLRQQNCWRTT